MNEDISTDNHLLKRITRVVVESEDLEALTVAWAICRIIIPILLYFI